MRLTLALPPVRVTGRNGWTSHAYCRLTDGDLAIYTLQPKPTREEVPTLVIKRTPELRDLLQRLLWELSPPRYFRCGGCDHLHPFGWTGDCRDNNQRFTDQHDRFHSIQ